MKPDPISIGAVLPYGNFVFVLLLIIFIMSSQQRQAKHWVATLNNPTDVEKQTIADYAGLPHVRYAIVGRETGSNGTPHLQIYFAFDKRLYFQVLKRDISARAHWEVARGTPTQNRAYCSKDGDFDEYGQIPSGRGSSGTLKDGKEWVDAFVGEHRRPPTERELAVGIPLPYLRNGRALLDYGRLVAPAPELVAVGGTQLYEWQRTLESELDAAPDDRAIKWFIDPVGNNGKSFFARYYLTKYPDRAQILGVGKRDDMTYSIDPTKDVFFVNVPRGSMEHLQYSVLEMIKDRVVISNKYISQVKYLYKQPHVVVFCNEEPDQNKLSQDRFELLRF